jgi:hypothetical protein
MTTLVTILAEDYADWEIAPLAAVARGFYGLRVRHAAPGGRQLTSAAGLRVTPDLALDAIDLETTDALVVCGGTIWQTDRAPDLSELLVAAHEGASSSAASATERGRWHGPACSMASGTPATPSIRCSRPATRER